MRLDLQFYCSRHNWWVAFDGATTNHVFLMKEWEFLIHEARFGITAVSAHPEFSLARANGFTALAWLLLREVSVHRKMQGVFAFAYTTFLIQAHRARVAGAESCALAVAYNCLVLSQCLP